MNINQFSSPAKHVHKWRIVDNYTYKTKFGKKTKIYEYCDDYKCVEQRNRETIQYNWFGKHFGKYFKYNEMTVIKLPYLIFVGGLGLVNLAVAGTLIMAGKQGWEFNIIVFLCISFFWFKIALDK